MRLRRLFIPEPVKCSMKGAIPLLSVNVFTGFWFIVLIRYFAREDSIFQSIGPRVDWMFPQLSFDCLHFSID